MTCGSERIPAPRGAKRRGRGMDVVHPEIDDRMTRRLLARLGREHEANAAAVEEGERRRRLEEEPQAERVAVEGDGARQVRNRVGELRDAADSGGVIGRFLRCVSVEFIPASSAVRQVAEEELAVVDHFDPAARIGGRREDRVERSSIARVAIGSGRRNVGRRQEPRPQAVGVERLDGSRPERSRIGPPKNDAQPRRADAAVSDLRVVGAEVEQQRLVLLEERRSGRAAGSSRPAPRVAAERGSAGARRALPRRRTSGTPARRRRDRPRRPAGRCFGAASNERNRGSPVEAALGRAAHLGVGFHREHVVPAGEQKLGEEAGSRSDIDHPAPGKRARPPRRGTTSSSRG